MKFTSSDVHNLRVALMACKLAGLDTVVISNGLVRGLNEKRNAAVFSKIELSIDPAISIGITRLSELEKRLTLFGDLVLVEGELNDANKVRKLTIKGKTGKIEFRCTDEKLIMYPKEDNDEPGLVMTLTKGEVNLIAKGAKTLGVEALTLQVKRDGKVHFECADISQDRFEIDLENDAQFVDDAYPYVNPFDVSSGGVFLALLEHMAKDQDTVELIVMKTGNITLRAFGHEVRAIPRIQNGE